MDECRKEIQLLHGVKVIELNGLAPVPFCGMILADFGAQVTWVLNKSSLVAQFEQRLCRGKTKLMLDFKCPNDVEKLKELCRTSDVLLDPFRPGTLESLGLDPKELTKANRGLVVARLTGYGQSGPMAKKGGHDINYVALSGLLPTISGCLSRQPWPPANLLADIAGGGLLAAFGIVSALFRRTKNGGVGCVLDCAMTEGLAYLGTFINLNWDQRWMWDGDQFGLFTGRSPIYRTYETADGKWMAVGALEPKFQNEFFQTLGLDDISIGGNQELTMQLERIFRGKTQSEWSRIFKDKDACVTPVLDLSDEHFGEFEHHKARGSYSLVRAGQRVLWSPKASPIEIRTEVEEGRMRAKL